MATEKIALGINLRQNKNNKNTAAYGKYYPEVDVQKTLSLRGFAQHMTDHNSHFSRAIVEGVLVAEGAAVESIEAMEGLDPNDIVKGIHIRFQPDASKLDNLCSPAFKAACSLELRNIVDTKEVTIGGKKRKVQILKPIATAVAEARAGASFDDEETGGSGSGSGSQGSGTETPSGGGDTPGGNTGGGGNDDPDDGVIS